MLEKLNVALRMKTLAIEFSTKQREVAIAEGDEVLTTVTTDNLETGPITLIDNALQNSGLNREEIEIIALGIGPGSYNGIRSAIAVAQGWQLAREIKLCAISSVEALAKTARQNGHRGLSHFIIDAQRHQYYHCTWNLTDTHQTETKPLSIIEACDAAQLNAHGPDADGLSSCQSLYPKAGILAHLASTQREFQRGSSIEPIYLRQTNFVKAPPPRKL